MDLKSALINLQCELVAERTLANPQNISWIQYDILCQLEKLGALLPSKLSVLLGTSRTKLSKSLKDLKALGYITQLPNQLDGRELYTSITPEGQVLLNGIFNKHTALYQSALNTLTIDEQQEFARLSAKFSEGLRKGRMDSYE
jgi:DNA-binding MarR family transcriptional regulator